MTQPHDLHCVVGSGLSGIAAAFALLKRGKQVLMLDTGLDITPEIAEKVRVMASKPAWQWTTEEASLLQEGFECGVSGVKEKLLFGSDFASRSINQAPMELSEVKCYRSFARNGLGNIWGAGLLPFRQDDIADWPINATDLYPFYKEILNFMPISGRHDQFEEEYPFFVMPSFHAPSRQAARLLERLSHNKAKLNKAGIRFGASRLAANFHGRKTGYDCQYCGKCLVGCPYEVPYSGRQTLKELRKQKGFVYRQGYLMRRFERDGANLLIKGVDPDSGRLMGDIRVGKIYLATGVFSTARIILESLGLFNRPIRILNSDQYYTPMLSFSAMRKVTQENLHTMCQAFIIINNQAVSPHSVHFSIYTYNDFFKYALENMLGFATKPLTPLYESLLNRLYYFISYVHSDHSSQMTLTLRNDARKSLFVTSNGGGVSDQVMQKARRLLFKLSPFTGLVPLLGYKGRKLPGAGNHFGGSFPMSKAPHQLATDPYGRLNEFDDVFLVDASVFPSIPATSITFSIMANAYRNAVASITKI